MVLKESTILCVLRRSSNLPHAFEYFGMFNFKNSYTCKYHLTKTLITALSISQTILSWMNLSLAFLIFLSRLSINCYYSKTQNKEFIRYLMIVMTFFLAYDL